MMIYKVDTVYTDDDVRAILERRGIITQYRESVYWDGDTPVPFRQWQAWNPFKMEWRPMDQVFRQGLQRATEELQRERLDLMSLDNFFK